MLYEFCRIFHTLSSSAKFFENRLRFDKVTESSKVKTFLRHSVLVLIVTYICSLLVPYNRLKYAKAIG